MTKGQTSNASKPRQAHTLDDSAKARRPKTNTRNILVQSDFSDSTEDARPGGVAEDRPEDKPGNNHDDQDAASRSGAEKTATRGRGKGAKFTPRQVERMKSDMQTTDPLGRPAAKDASHGLHLAFQTPPKAPPQEGDDIIDIYDGHGKHAENERAKHEQLIMPPADYPLTLGQFLMVLVFLIVVYAAGWIAARF